MWQQLMPAFRMTALMTVLTGIVYPLAITGIAQGIFSKPANGSLIEKDGKVIGSTLIGQNFSKQEYFHPRLSAAGSDGYDAMASGGSNLGPTNKKLVDRMKQSIQQFRADNPTFEGDVPADLLTTSASGLDPEISPAAADAQANRIAKARGAAVDAIQTLVRNHTETPDLGFLGEPRVNVLLLNLDLDQKFPVQAK
ncbi:MAG: potassium-transporting ATPase subunit KdpC [Bryobacteraceae bacterium]